MRGEHADRGGVWLERNRPDLAERELRMALTLDPEDAESHALLALCLVELERPDEALDEAMRALALDAGLVLAHYARTAALLAQGRHKPAEQAAKRLLELAPVFAPGYGLLAHSLVGQQRWRDALAASVEGLKLDAEDDTCANLRALALIQLGEAEQADFALAAALERDPENALTHQNIGFKALRRGDTDEAISHYREALRLEPQNPAAREGLVEALKSRNPVYRLFLRLVLLLTKVKPRTAMMILIGTVLARVVLRSVARAVPALGPFLWPLFWALVVFVFMTWIAPPLFNLLLRLDSAGRHALSDAQRRQTNWLAGTLLAAAALLVAHLFGSSWSVVAAGFAAALAIPVCATFSPDPTTNRRLLGAMTLGLAVVAVLCVWNGMAMERERVEIRGLVGVPLGDEKTTSDEVRAHVAAWAEEDPERLQALEARVDAVRAHRERFDQFLRVFMYGFVAFTWIAAGASMRGRS